MEEPLLSSRSLPTKSKSNASANNDDRNASSTPPIQTQPPTTNNASFLHKFLTDSRTEWSLRYTILHVIFYVLYFYPPKTNVNIDWSLPVQLISGGNLAFYNAGWHAWFGLGCAFAMVLAGCILSIIFPLLQANNFGGAYISLMAIFLLISLPMIRYIGILNNLRSIGFVLIIIFTEVFYGPLLNLRNVLPSARSIFVEFVGPNAIPSMAFIAICWAVYAVPPWHSATYQMLSLSSQVTSGVADCLHSAASMLKDKASNPNKENTEGKETPGRSLKLDLRSMANSLLQQTNYAGLYTPISLYGGMGIYETSIFYPTSSLPADSFHTLGKYIDQTVYHVALVLWAIGEVVDNVDDEDLLAATSKQLEAAGDLAAAIASVLECPRKSYRRQPITGRMENMKEAIVTNPKLFDIPIDSNHHTHAEARQLAEQALANTNNVTKHLQDTANASTNRLDALLLFNIVSDLTMGQENLVHFNHDRSILKEEGSLGRLMGVAENLQESWVDKCAWPRMVSRMTFMEAISDLFLCWCQGVLTLLSCQAGGILDKRNMSRALQYVLGALGLFAMATWWPEYSTLLGSSSTGQWSMVAFFVCFRSTADETIYVGIMRSIGHAIGGLLSWGINTAVLSSGGRIGCHSALTLVLTWFIPTPFSIRPSKFQFSFDTFGLTLLEGAMTTYHLTSVLVLSTSIESAAKSRIVSQCIGAGVAAAVSLVVFPWFAIPQAKRTLESFRSNLSFERLGCLDALESSAVTVEDLLQARRDISNRAEATAWMPAADTSGLSESLTNAAFGQLAMEGIVTHYYAAVGEAIPNEVTSALKAGDLDKAIGAIKLSISSNETPQNDLARLFIEILLLRESLE